MAEFRTVARVEELSDVGGKEVEVDGKRVCLFKHNGEVFATAALCPHKGVPLAVGWVEKGAVSCAMHGWEFDLRTGNCKNIPGQEVRTYMVRVVDGDVQVEVG
ncbi:MAG: Rieske (2Fe-2S) protein [Limisphaerales bacterium]